MGAAMQYLQSKGLCIMPSSIARVLPPPATAKSTDASAGTMAAGHTKCASSDEEKGTPMSGVSGEAMFNNAFGNMQKVDCLESINEEAMVAGGGVDRGTSHIEAATCVEPVQNHHGA